MIIRKVDSDNDWTFGKGINSYAKDEEAINQNVKARLLSWRNDCFFDLQAGVDWKSRLDIGQQEALEAELKAVILQSFGVVAVNSVSVNFNTQTRQFDVHYSMDTIYSQSFESQIELASGGS